jgi:hypothetical protein
MWTTPAQNRTFKCSADSTDGGVRRHTTYDAWSGLDRQPAQNWETVGNPHCLFCSLNLGSGVLSKIPYIEGYAAGTHMLGKLVTEIVNGMIDRYHFTRGTDHRQRLRIADGMRLSAVAIKICQVRGISSVSNEPTCCPSALLRLSGLIQASLVDGGVVT